jgi:hypothetical protein
VIIRRQMAAGAVKRTTSRAFCELDQWSFDPRYTDGRCPICGWAPEGAPSAPAWMRFARKLEWELVGLVLLAVVLVILGVLVARAAGYQLPGFNLHAPANAPQFASPARISSPSASPVHSSPSASPRSSASPSH